MKKLWFRISVVLLALLVGVPTAAAQDDPPPVGETDAAADEMQRFLDTLATMSQVVTDTTEPGSAERAEGLRHIVRLVEMQNSRFTDDANPANPFLSRCVMCKLGMDNPDFAYQAIEPISSEYEYRITGHRGTVPYITMQLFEGALGGAVTMTSEDLVIDDDGTFEIILSATEPTDADNWMEINDTAQSFLIRQGYNDWNTDVEASLEVEVIGGSDSAPVPHVTNEDFASDLGRLSNILGVLIPLMQDTRAGWLLNDLNEPSAAAFGIPNAGFPTTVGSVGTYQLAEDEALIIEMSDHGVIHGGIQLGNTWLESLDYRTRQTSLNWYQSVPDSDGKFRYVLSHTDPGTSNWLDVSGHGDGSIFIRWQDPSDDNTPATPEVSVVPLDSVLDELPEDHPTVTPEERARALELRDAGINRRRNPVDSPADVDTEVPSASTSVPTTTSTPTSAAEEAAVDLPDESDSDSTLGVILAAIGIPAAAVIGWLLGRRRPRPSSTS